MDNTISIKDIYDIINDEKSYGYRIVMLDELTSLKFNEAVITLGLLDYQKEQILKQFVSDLKDHTFQAGNERAVKVSVLERLLKEYIG